MFMHNNYRSCPNCGLWFDNGRAMCNVCEIAAYEVSLLFTLHFGQDESAKREARETLEMLGVL